MNFVKVFVTCKKVTKTMGEDQKERQANCMRRIYSALVRVDLSHAFPIFFHAIVRSFVRSEYPHIESLTRGNLEIARIGRETISGAADARDGRTGRAGKAGNRSLGVS